MGRNKEDEREEVEEEAEEVDEASAGEEEELEVEEEQAGGEAQDISDLLGKMSIGRASTKSPFGMEVVFPYFLYTYEEMDQMHVTIDFLVFGFKESAFRPQVASGGQELELRTIIPPMFVHPDRLFQANEEINDNTHKATAYKMMVDSIQKKHGDGTSEQRLFGDPQRVKLPFTCEQEISMWEVQHFPNSDRDFDPMTGHTHMVSILAIDLVATEKRVRKRNGGVRVFGSPSGTRNNNNYPNNNNNDNYNYDDEDNATMVRADE